MIHNLHSRLTSILIAPQHGYYMTSVIDKLSSLDPVYLCVPSFLLVLSLDLELRKRMHIRYCDARDNMSRIRKTLALEPKIEYRSRPATPDEEVLVDGMRDLTNLLLEFVRVKTWISAGIEIIEALKRTHATCEAGIPTPPDDAEFRASNEVARRIESVGMDLERLQRAVEMREQETRGILQSVCCGLVIDATSRDADVWLGVLLHCCSRQQSQP